MNYEHRSFLLLACFISLNILIFYFVEGDIDALCLLPNFVDRTKVFNELPRFLTEHLDVQGLRKVENAYVPIISFIYQENNVSRCMWHMLQVIRQYFTSLYKESWCFACLFAQTSKSKFFVTIFTVRCMLCCLTNATHFERHWLFQWRHIGRLGRAQYEKHEWCPWRQTATRASACRRQIPINTKSHQALGKE